MVVVGGAVVPGTGGVLVVDDVTAGSVAGTATAGCSTTTIRWGASVAAGGVEVAAAVAAIAPTRLIPTATLAPAARILAPVAGFVFVGRGERTGGAGVVSGCPELRVVASGSVVVMFFAFLVAVVVLFVFVFLVGFAIPRLAFVGFGRGTCVGRNGFCCFRC